MTEYVFDTSALIAYIQNEEGAETIADLLGKVLDGKVRIFISTITAIELFSASVKRQGWAVAEERLEQMEDLPLIQEPLTPNLCKTIGEIQFESFARAIPGSAKQRIEKNVIFSILQNQMLITFDFGGASLCHEILHFVQKSQIIALRGECHRFR